MEEISFDSGGAELSELSCDDSAFSLARAAITGDSEIFRAISAAFLSIGNQTSAANSAAKYRSRNCNVCNSGPGVAILAGFGSSFAIGFGFPTWGNRSSAQSTEVGIESTQERTSAQSLRLKLRHRAFRSPLRNAPECSGIFRSGISAPNSDDLGRAIVRFVALSDQNPENQN